MSGVVAGEGPKSKSGIPVLHAGSHFRHGLLQLMIHTIDPLHDGKNIFLHYPGGPRIVWIQSDFKQCSFTILVPKGLDFIV